MMCLCCIRQRERVLTGVAGSNVDRGNVEICRGNTQNSELVIVGSETQSKCDVLTLTYPTEYRVSIAETCMFTSMKKPIGVPLECTIANQLESVSMTLVASQESHDQMFRVLIEWQSRHTHTRPEQSQGGPGSAAMHGQEGRELLCGLC